MKKKGIFAILVAAVMLLGACTPTGGGSAARTDLNIVLTSEPLGLDPSTAYSGADAYVVRNIFDTLVELSPDGKIVASLAESWDISDDLLSYTFHLKSGVKFHNGDPMKASDVKFSLDNAKEKGYATETTDLFEEVIVLDDSTVQVTMNAPNVGLISGFTGQYLSIVNEALYTQAGDSFAMNPGSAGTGAYKFVSWEAGVAIKMEKNNDYHGKVANIKDINIRFIAESSAAVIALETGVADIISPSFLDAKNLEGKSDIQVKIKEGNQVYYLLYNMNKEPFTDLNVRKAMAYAINRADMVVAVANGNGAYVTNSLCIPSSFGYNSDIPTFDQDLDAAADYMAQSGYPNGFSCELTISSGLSATAAVLKDQLAKINIDLVIESLDFSAMASKYMSGDMDMGIMNSSTPTPDTGMELNDKIVSAAWINFGKYSNPVFDKLIADSLATKDEATRRQWLHEAQQILIDDMPVIPMYVNNSVMAANAKLKNFDYDARTNNIDLKSLSW